MPRSTKLSMNLEALTAAESTLLSGTGTHRQTGNRWRKLRYTLLAPLYDLGAAGHGGWRLRAVQLLDIQPHSRVLVIGAGTGQDLAFLPDDVFVTAVDLVPAMLRRARQRRPDARFLTMDAGRLEFLDQSFDVVLLHQVLEVVMQPESCLREAARVLAVGGRLSVFDKFIRPDDRPTAIRRFVYRCLDAFFTTTKLVFEDIVQAAGAPLSLTVDEACDDGPFRIILLTRR